MNRVKLLKITFLIIVTCSCQMRNIRSLPLLSSKMCTSDGIKMNFEPVKDISSVLLNQKLASSYFYYQRKRYENDTNCYRSIIEKMSGK